MTQEEFKALEYSLDEYGNLRVGDYDMMFVSEQEIIQTGIELLKNQVNYNSVIEIGFGLGFTATKFQELGIGRHIIIEPHPDIYQKALQWKVNYPDANIVIYNEFWQEWSNAENADLVYFDMNDLVFQSNGLQIMGEEEADGFGRYANIVFASYARENCELPEFIETITFENNNKTYLQPYKLTNNNN